MAAKFGGVRLQATDISINALGPWRIIVTREQLNMVFLRAEVYN
jgi:hypothetical protein